MKTQLIAAALLIGLLMTVPCRAQAPADEPFISESANSPTVPTEDLDANDVGAAVAPVRGTLSGHIYVEQEDLVDLANGATVELVSLDDRVLGKVVTGEDGYYVFHGIGVGAFQLSVTSPTAPALKEQIQVAEDKGIHILDFVLAGRSGQPAPGKVIAHVFEESETGRFRRTDASILATRGEKRQIISQADPLSGAFETSLEAGKWQVAVNVPGLAPINTVFDVKAGETIEQEIVIPSDSSESSVTALVAVVKQQGDVATPEVSFTDGTNTVPAILEKAPRADDSQSSWHWFLAKPSAALTPGNYAVTGSCEGYFDSSTATQPVGEGTVTFQLTFRPESDVATVSGLVSTRATGDEEAKPAAGAIIEFASQDSEETVRVVADENGKYVTHLASGKWWGTATDGEHSVNRPAFVSITANQDTSQNFEILSSPNATPNDGEQLVEALIAVLAEGSTNTPQVKFLSQSSAVDAMTKRLEPDEMTELGLDPADTVWNWFIAVPMEALPSGVWRVEAAIDEMRDESRPHRIAEDSYLSFHLHLNAPSSDVGTLIAQITTELGEPVGPGRLHLWSDEGNLAPLTVEFDESGRLMVDLAQGLWWGVPNVAGYDAVAATGCLVAAGENPKTYLVSRPLPSSLSTIVSVQRSWTGVQSELPSVTFSGNGSEVVASVRRINRNQSPGGGASSARSHWDWFEAVSKQPLEPGSYQVRANLDGYVPAEQPATVIPESFSSVFLTLRSDSAPTDKKTKLQGGVYLVEQTGNRVLRSDSTVAFLPMQQGDEVTAPAADGNYLAELTPGTWIAGVFDAAGTLLISDAISVGDSPEATYDFEIPANGNSNSGLVAVVEVIAIDGTTPAPEVQFVVTKGENTQYVAGAVSEIPGTKTEESTLFLARPRKQLDVESACIAIANCGNGYREASSKRVVLVAGQLHELAMTVHPKWMPSQPGMLAGCILHETSAEAIAESDDPPFVENALLSLKHVETGQILHGAVPGGCFEVELLPGRWTATVKLPGMQPWRMPGEILVPEGELIEQDIVVPVTQRDDGPLATDIRVFVGVAASGGREMSASPVVSLVPMVTKSVIKQVLKETPQGIIYDDVMVEEFAEGEPIGCSVISLQPTDYRQFGLPIEAEGNQWVWFLARPENPLPVGSYSVKASADGCTVLFGTEQVRSVQAGLPTVFEVGLAPLVPQIDLLVLNSSEQPQGDVDIRFVNRDLSQSLKDAASCKSDAAGQAHIELNSGTGTYNVLLSGSGIEPQGRVIQIIEPTSTISFQVFAKGEMKVYPLSGRVVGTTTDGATLPVAEATVSLRSLGNQGLPASVRPLISGADGAFSWTGVPTGQYEILVESADYQRAQQLVQVTEATPSIQVILRKRNPEFAAAIRQILVDGWGNTAEAKQAAVAGYTKAKALAPDYVMVDLAMSLVHIHNEKLIDAHQLLARVNRGSSEVFAPELCEQFADRTSEAQIWVHLLLSRYQEVTTDLQTLATTVYATEPTICGDETAYLMGIGSGMMLGPKQDKARGFNMQFDAQIEATLCAALAQEYARGRDSVLNGHQQMEQGIDAQLAEAERQLSAEKAEQLADLKTQLATCEQRLQELERLHTDGLQKANKRYGEIEGELGQLIQQRDALSRRGKEIEDQYANLERQLCNLLNQPLPQQGEGGLNGGFQPQQPIIPNGGGGMQPPNGGGGGFPGLNNPPGLDPQEFGDPLFPNGGGAIIPVGPLKQKTQRVFFQGFDLNAAEQERQITAEMFRLENLHGELLLEYNQLSVRINARNNDLAIVNNAWAQTYNKLDTDYRNQQVLRNQLVSRMQKITGMKPQGMEELEAQKSEAADVRQYYSYPIEVRRQEILDSL
ncbi:MAG: carboxypeptidase regulatory-like domain-containing protein [Planctomycetaceae bacterium]